MDTKTATACAAMFLAANGVNVTKGMRRRMRRAAQAAQRCADCGERGERTGHAACPEAGRVSDREVRGEAGDLYDVQGVER